MTVKHWNTGASAVRFRDQADKQKMHKCLNLIEDKLKQILEICKTNAVYDWDSNMENSPQDEFKEIIKIIKDKWK